MRQFELSTDIPAGRERAWQTLERLSEWSIWNRLVPHAAGELRPGSRLDLKIRGRSGRLSPFHPVVVSVAPPRELVLMASIGRGWLLHLVHTFSLEVISPGTSRLQQRWNATGLLVPFLWPVIWRGMARFEEFGSDLASRTAEGTHRAGGPRDATVDATATKGGHRI
jgi:hypothetical protein